MLTRGPIWHHVRHLVTRSREVLRAGDSIFSRSEIWQASQQQCCSGTSQNSKWFEYLNPQSHRFEWDIVQCYGLSLIFNQGSVSTFNHGQCCDFYIKIPSLYCFPKFLFNIFIGVYHDWCQFVKMTCWEYTSTSYKWSYSKISHSQWFECERM